MCQTSAISPQSEATRASGSIGRSRLKAIHTLVCLQSADECPTRHPEGIIKNLLPLSQIITGALLGHMITASHDPICPRVAASNQLHNNEGRKTSSCTLKPACVPLFQHLLLLLLLLGAAGGAALMFQRAVLSERQFVLSLKCRSIFRRSCPLRKDNSAKWD